MKTQYEFNVINAIFKAKLFIESLFLESEQLRWLCTKPLNSFDDERNTVKLYVLEGSPPRGFIIANYATGTVTAFDIHMRMRITTCVSGLAWPE